MRLAVFAEYLPPKLGSDRRIYEIMKRLANKHEVHFIVFPPFRELRNQSLRSGKSHARSQEKQTAIMHEGISGHWITISPKVASLWQQSLIIAYCLTAIAVFVKSMRVLKNISPEVIVLNYPSPYTGLLGFLAARLWRRHVVADFNDLIAQYTGALLGLRKESFMAKLLVQVQNYIVRNSEKTIAPTFFIKEYATSLGVSQRKIAVVPNGVDTRSFDPNKSSEASSKNSLRVSDDKLCVYCGRLDGWAGMNIIMKLCEAASARRMRVKFVLAGSGGREVAKKENVIYVGEILHEKVPDFLAVADAVLIPFPDNEVSHAASPLKLFEGMSMQKPVIASRVSGIEEVISEGENGFLADPNGIDEWVRKLQIVLGSKKLAARVGACARKTVESGFEWSLLAEKYEEILNAVCLE